MSDLRIWIDLVAGETETRRLNERVFHGSPHDVAQFNTEFIGSGQGANSYGWGLYFAGERSVAKHYRELLAPKAGRRMTVDWPEWLGLGSVTDVSVKAKELFSEPSMVEAVLILWNAIGGYQYRSFRGGVTDAVDACRRFGDLSHYGTTIEDVAKVAAELYQTSTGAHPGALYTVELPSRSTFLLWDKSLASQPRPVKRALGQLLPSLGAEPSAEPPAKSVKQTGKSLYKKLVSEVGSPKAASLALLKHGIHGIRYLDAASRQTGKGTFNYVIFDGAFTKIVSQEGV